MAKTKDIPPGYKDSPLGPIPNEWRVMELKEIYDDINTPSFSRDNLTNEKTANEVHYIHYGDIHATYKTELLDLNTETRIPFLKDEFCRDNLNYLEEGDLVIVDASEDYEGVGQCVEIKNVNNKKVIGGLHTIVLRSKKNKTSLGFNTYIFKNAKVHHELKRIATGISVFGISKGNLLKLKIPIPPLTEQSSIANLLITWDKAIQTTTQLIEQKQQRKKWLMQQLLTGKKRLKGFEKEKWKADKLSNYTKKVKGKVFEVSEDKSGAPCITASTFNGNYLEFTNATGAVRCSKNDVLVLWDGENAGTVTTNHEGIVGSTIAKLILKKDLNNFFLTYKLQFENKKLRAIREGSGIPHMPGDFEDWYHFNIPKIEEQRAIAKVLLDADKEIKLLQNKLDKLKEQKKGLMQVLLTGKKRLKI